MELKKHLKKKKNLKLENLLKKQVLNIKNHIFKYTILKKIKK